MNMKLVALALGAAVLSANALAQETQPIGLSFRAGLFLPTGSAARDQSTAWGAFGLDYKLRDLTLRNGAPASLSFSLDYSTRNDFRTTPLLINFVGRSNELYYTAGVGASISRYPGRRGLNDRTTFAYALGIGYDFQQGRTPLFVEGKFLGNERSELNGFAFYVGVRL